MIANNNQNTSSMVIDNNHNTIHKLPQNAIVSKNASLITSTTIKTTSNNNLITSITTITDQWNQNFNLPSYTEGQQLSRGKKI